MKTVPPPASTAVSRAFPRARTRALVTILALTGCGDRTVPPMPVDDFITCIADRDAGSVRCLGGTAAARPSLDRTGTALVLTGQHADVAVLIDDAVFRDSAVTFSAVVKNLTGQRIGTTNGTDADPRGIRLVFVPPADTGDIMPLAAPVPTAVVTRDSSTSTAAPAIRLTGVLDSGSVSAAAEVTLRLPSAAKRVRFALVVVAPVQFPRGWIRIMPAAIVAAVGQPTRLTADTYTAVGREALPVAISWRLVDGNDVATLSSKGELAGVRLGLAHVVASCEDPCTAPPDSAWIPITLQGTVTLAVEPQSSFAISRFIYGVNFLSDDGARMATLPPWYGATVPPTVTLSRLGGNRFSAYNWTNNFSNAGADYRFQNDRYLEPTATPGEAIRRRVADAAARGAASIVTVPMLPFVARNDLGTPLDTAGATHQQRMREHFAPNRADISASDELGTVSQRAFVEWLQARFPGSARDSLRPIFFSLDNEPDIWHTTHRTIMSDTARGRRLQTYDGFTRTSVQFARMIKSVQPRARVFGPATATITGMLTLGQHPDRDPVHGTNPFLEVYLAQFRDAEAVAGRRLLDVLDVHWYPEMEAHGASVSDDMAAQDSTMVRIRMDATRSLWDSTYNEGSWVSRVVGGAVELIPRLRRMVARQYPGTALSISEYFYGRGGDIAGGIAQTDALGIFGREGLFAATLWPQAQPAAYGGSGERAYAYIFGAFRLFRDYDGTGGQFGSVGLAARSSDLARATVYASVRENGTRVLVVSNHTTREIDAVIPITSGPQPRGAQVWTMRDGAPVPLRGADLVTTPGSALSFRMPALSASTLVLMP